MNKQITSFFYQIAPLLLGWLLAVPLYAQQELPALPMAQLNRPAGWQLVGAVSATADGSSLKTQPGSTILTGSGAPLTLLTPTDDFRLRFDILLSASADFVLTLPTGQTMSFAGTQELARLTKAPGLWQTVDVW